MVQKIIDFSQPHAILGIACEKEALLGKLELSNDSYQGGFSMTNYEQYQRQSQEYGARLKEFVEPLLIKLDDYLDKRLVRTFLKTLEAIITFRHTVYGLLLSELGGCILSLEHAPAGTKRLGNCVLSGQESRS